MVPKLDHDRREWLPAYAIAWISVTTVTVCLRLALRTASRNFSVDDVSLSILACLPVYADKTVGSNDTFFDHLHCFREPCSVLLQGRDHGSACLRHGPVENPCVRTDRMDSRVAVCDWHLLRQTLSPVLLPPHGERCPWAKMADRNLGRSRFCRNAHTRLHISPGIRFQLHALYRNRKQGWDAGRAGQFLPEHT